MATVTPRRSTRTPHNYTPKMTERKKGLFQGDVEGPRESLTQHRRLPVVESESDNDECDLGIMGTLDSSSGDEQQDQNALQTPERPWHATRSHSKRFLKDTHDLKDFIKSPFTLNKYQTRYSYPDSKCSPLSTPATPHVHHHPMTPSSSHSCTSVHTTSSTSSKARKSLASLIADTESCSSSLKDLNFDTDSGTDSKENTPTKPTRRSGRKLKMTPKFASFKGILMEHKKNASPSKLPLVCLTKMDMTSIMSPTQMLKTPQTTDNSTSPPKISHSRRAVVEIAESPEDYCDSDKSHKRLRNDSLSDLGPKCKHPKLDTSGSAPKARLSLFNSDKLKEILSTKCFYGKKEPDLNSSITTKISRAIIATTHTNQKRQLSTSYSNKRKSRKSGQINMGVKHRIRKPKFNKSKIVLLNRSTNSKSGNESGLNNSALSNTNLNNTSMRSQNSSQDYNDKADPFDNEKQTIDALLSQWNEEVIPDPELSFIRKQVPCFNSTVIEETDQIFKPVAAVPVKATENTTPQSEVIIELGAQNRPSKEADTGDVVMREQESHSDSHGVPHKGFLPVEGGYIMVDDAVETVPDLDEIERELKMLDEQILKMAQSNNIDPQAVLASTETPVSTEVATAGTSQDGDGDNRPKLFPIFSSPNPGNVTTSKCTTNGSSKKLVKTGLDQYVIDAGQKHFGATQCKECGVIYQIGDAQDEHDHLVHHNATDVLRFNGWKEERVVGTWEGGAARCVLVRGSEPGWRRVETLLSRVLHPQLGYSDTLPRDNYCYTAYMYVEKRQIVGCLVVEPILKAYKLLPGNPDCCSVEDYPVKCGVSRVWTHVSHRRRGVSRRLLDCARATFLYGAGLRLEDIAFSAPTAAGKALATAYCGTPNFFVYLD